MSVATSIYRGILAPPALYRNIFVINTKFSKLGQINKKAYTSFFGVALKVIVPDGHRVQFAALSCKMLVT